MIATAPTGLSTGWQGKRVVLVLVNGGQLAFDSLVAGTHLPPTVFQT